MLILCLVLLLLSTSITSRKDKSILCSRDIISHVGFILSTFFTSRQDKSIIGSRVTISHRSIILLFLILDLIIILTVFIVKVYLKLGFFVGIGVMHYY